MEYKAVVPTESQVLTFTNPVTLPLLIQLSASLQLGYPTPGDAKWFEKMFTLQYDHSPGFWSPYAVTPSGVCIKPWAHSGRRYVGRAISGGMEPEQLDPAEWRENLANLIADVTFADLDVTRAMELMRIQYVEPEGDLLLRRDAMDQRVRQAIASRSLVYNMKRARAMLESSTKYLDGAP